MMLPSVLESITNSTGAMFQRNIAHLLWNIARLLQNIAYR
jgi:hypothetical protein